MASKVLVPAAPFAKLKVQKSPAELPPAQGFIIGSDAASRVAHLEHSVRFLQEQHRLMLSGLHNEIEALRERNRDLQFQLIFNKESASKNNSPNAEDKENVPTENTEVETLKAEVLKLKHEAAAARSEARAAEARSLQLQRLIDLQSEKLREQERRKLCTGDHCDIDETRSELRARLADAERLVRRLRGDAERQRREVQPAPGDGVTNLLFDGVHHLQCMKNSLHASLRASGVEYGYQNYHFAGPEYWQHQPQPQPHANSECRGGGRVSRRVLTLPELARHHQHRNTVIANQHTVPVQARVPAPGSYDTPRAGADQNTAANAHQHHDENTEPPNTNAPIESVSNTKTSNVDLHITKSLTTYPQLKVVVARMIPHYNVSPSTEPTPRPRARRHRKHNDHT